MTALLPFVVLAASLVTLPQTAQKQESALDVLKQFEGRWKGDFTMGSMKMDVDMTWTSFGGRWVEVSYTYSNAQTKLEYRVLMTTNADQSGLNVWMFGSGQPAPDEMKGAIDGKALNVLHVRANQPDVKFWLDDDKNMVMSVTMPDEKRTEIAHGLLKPVKV